MQLWAAGCWMPLRKTTSPSASSARCWRRYRQPVGGGPPRALTAFTNITMVGVSLLAGEALLGPIADGPFGLHLRLAACGSPCKGEDHPVAVVAVRIGVVCQDRDVDRLTRAGDGRVVGRRRAWLAPSSWR